MEDLYSKILRYDRFILPEDMIALKLWLKKLLGPEFKMWVRGFNYVEWTRKLSDLTCLQLAQGIKNFTQHREHILSQYVRPFPINWIKFKEFCKVPLTHEELLLICGSIEVDVNG